MQAKIAVLGPKGSYSEQALCAYNPAAHPLFYKSIPDIIDAIAKGKVREALLPYENSIQGTVLETLDGIYRRRLHITTEITVPIEQVIAGNSRSKIVTIYSHPQALAQCARYLRKHYPRATQVETLSTAAAFALAKKQGKGLAIGSAFAARTYGLNVLASSIQDVKNNRTLFVVVKKRLSKQRPSFTLLGIHPKTDRPGILHDILGVFKKYKINLLKLESRPSRERLGEYIFYIKAELAADDVRQSKVLKALSMYGSVTLLT